MAFDNSGGINEVSEPLEPENIVDNEEALAQRIMYYYIHREEISSKSAARIAYARTNFSIERMERDYYENYECLL